MIRSGCLSSLAFNSFDSHSGWWCPALGTFVFTCLLGSGSGFGCLSSLVSQLMCLPAWLVFQIHLQPSVSRLICLPVWLVVCMSVFPCLPLICLPVWLVVSGFMCLPVWLVVSGSLDVGGRFKLRFKSFNNNNKPCFFPLACFSVQLVFPCFSIEIVFPCSLFSPLVSCLFFIFFPSVFLSL